MDVLRELGALAFASRLKRLSDRLYREVSNVYTDLDVDFEARWFPVLHLLSLHRELAVTEVAARLGLSHPAVHQVARAMARHDLIASRRDPTDERRRLLSLSRAGRELVTRLAPVWRSVRRETERLLAESGVDMLAALDRIEASLDRETMAERLGRQLPLPSPATLELVDYEPGLSAAFARLNREWLEEYFHVEPADARVLADPEGQIIAGGGCILFAVEEGSPLGTVAMRRLDEEAFQMTKLAVTASARGRGIGRALVQEAIERAVRAGGRRIVAHTSPRLNAALALYGQLGFEPGAMSDEDRDRYERETIALELKLDSEPVA